MSIVAKICGLSTPSSVDMAIEHGADMVGFVFFARSPRAVSPAQAEPLCARVPAGVTRVGLIVDAEDDEIAVILNEAPLDMLQLHGTESPERVAAVRERFGLSVMKACGISDADDVKHAAQYEDVADYLLLDAKPPKGADRPGGNAVTFDWTLPGTRTWTKPWLLAGGLDAGNVADALRISGAPGIDVSSGVEDAPGVKNVEKIAAFLSAAKSSNLAE